MLITGHNGYIGSVMSRLISTRHDVVGLDAYYFERCTLGTERADLRAFRLDLRDVREEHLTGLDAVIHLAALSSDPLGNSHAEAAYEINHRASVRLAHMAKAARVPRFLFASSCAPYGVSDEVLDETAVANPITPYDESKILVERDVLPLADETFTPVFLRCAVAYGASPRLRLDLAVNNLVGAALATGEVLVQSDGTAWRPLVHVEDLSRAFLAVLEAPKERVHAQTFNVGRTDENYRVSELAELVRRAVPGSTVRYAEGGGPEPRSHRVNCDKLALAVPAYKTTWRVPDGVAQLVERYRAAGFGREQWEGTRYFRTKRMRELIEQQRLDAHLRWTAKASITGPRPALVVPR